MTDELSPGLIAAAISALGREQVREAWRYTEAWRVLSAAGVPVLELRHALERPTRKTEPTRVTDEWDRRGARGLLVMHGKPGTGKTHSAALWALRRFDARRPTTWLPCASWPSYGFDEQQAWIKRGEQAPALVLDDLGAGATAAEYARKPLEGLLMQRLSQSRPTLVLSNANLAETSAWLGPRLNDRLKMAGGIYSLTMGDSLRELDDTDVDELGRSPTWHRNTEICALLGCWLDDGALVIGRALVAAADNGANNRAAEMLGLHKGKVRARAHERQREEQASADEYRNMVARLCSEYGVEFDVRFCDGADGMRAMLDAVAMKRAADEAARRAELRALALVPSEEKTG